MNQRSREALQPLGDATATFLKPVPFFSRLRVKHGVVLAVLVGLAMTVATALQMREALNEIQRSAVEKGRTAAAALAPLIVSTLKQNKLRELEPYFLKIEEERAIDYVQLVEADGQVVLETHSHPGKRFARPLHKGWLHQFGNRVRLDRDPVFTRWPEAEPGVDVFVALPREPGELQTAEAIEKALHLRIGVNFDDVVQRDIPRVMWRMLILTLIVTAVIIAAVLMWLTYVLRPLRELHQGLRAVAEGHLDYQVPVHTRDEVGRLIQMFNATLSRLRSAFQRIEELATHDALTGLPNRRVYDERLAAEAARSRRYGHPFGLIVLDLDHFKEVNDQHGHLAGDEVLRVIARVIEANIRETDLAARIGGEEFAVILPESNAREVQAVAEKLRLAVAQTQLQPKHGLPVDKRVTVSGGAVCSAGRLVTPEAMALAADSALYQSKSAGRNKVTLAPQQAGKSDMVSGVKDEPPPINNMLDFKI